MSNVDVNRFLDAFSGWLKSETFATVATGMTRRKILEYCYLIRKLVITQKKMIGIQEVLAGQSGHPSQGSGEQLSSSDSSEEEETAIARTVPDQEKLSDKEIKGLIAHVIGLLRKYLPQLNNLEMEVYVGSFLLVSRAPEALKESVLLY